MERALVGFGNRVGTPKVFFPTLPNPIEWSEAQSGSATHSPAQPKQRVDYFILRCCRTRFSRAVLGDTVPATPSLELTMDNEVARGCRTRM